MTITVHPINAVTGAPSYSGKMHRQVLSVGLEGATATRQLGARTGVRKGTPATTVAATSTTWTVTPLAGIIDLETSAVAGAYWFASDANVTGAVTAANASNPRIDIITVKVDDPAESDGSSVPAVTINYTAGTAAASPVAPATPARSFVIATITVPTLGGGSPAVVWNAPYTVASGGVIPVRSQAERDAITFGTAENPVTVDRLDTGATERSVASGQWVTIGAGYTLARDVPVSISGTVTTTPVDFASGQVIAAKPFGEIAYNLRIHAAIEVSIPAGLGAQLDILLDGSSVTLAKFTNAGGSSMSTTLTIDRTLFIVDGAAHTVRVTVVGLAGNVTVVASTARVWEMSATAKRTL